jgi:hypothetical protein
MKPNRIAVYLTAIAGLLTALAPVVADLDWTSTAGVIAGFVGVAGVVAKWLDGWQKHEARAAGIAGLAEGVKAKGFEPED